MNKILIYYFSSKLEELRTIKIIQLDNPIENTSSKEKSSKFVSPREKRIIRKLQKIHNIIVDLKSEKQNDINILVENLTNDKSSKNIIDENKLENKEFLSHKENSYDENRGDLKREVKIELIDELNDKS